MQTVLTIAGFDPSSGAGVTADLMVFAAHGLFGTACITGLTVQSTLGVRSSHPVEGQIVADTLDCLDADLRPAGIKIGMLSSAANIHRICVYLTILRQTDAIHATPWSGVVVLDPVLKSSSGRELLDPAALKLVGERLLPLVDWITPNVDELGVLVGEAVSSREDLPRVSRRLQERFGVNSIGRRLGVLATGGHMEPPDDFLLTPEGEGVWLPGRRVVTRATHGTGCALSSAFLSRLVVGDTPHEAALLAKNYVAGAMETAEEIGLGRSPMNYLWHINKVTD